jgi:hypothetical protein
MEKTGLPKLKQIMAERVKSRLDPFSKFFRPDQFNFMIYITAECFESETLQKWPEP